MISFSIWRNSGRRHTHTTRTGTGTPVAFRSRRAKNVENGINVRASCAIKLLIRPVYYSYYMTSTVRNGFRVPFACRHMNDIEPVCHCRHRRRRRLEQSRGGKWPRTVYLCSFGVALYNGVNAKRNGREKISKNLMFSFRIHSHKP